MARFKDDQQVYSLIGGMFEDVLADESAGRRMRAVGGTVQWELRRPNARITVRLGDDVEHGVDCGQTGAKPEVVLSMDAETAHRFWAGELPLHVALSRGLIRAKGPVATILRIVPVVGPARELYAARLAGGGGTAAPADAEAPGETQVVAEAESEADAAERDAEASAEPAEAEASAEPAEAEASAESVEAELPAEPVEAELPAEPAEAEASAEPAEAEASAESVEAEVPAEPGAEASAESVEAEAPAEPELEAEKPGEPDMPAGGEEITPS